MGAFFWRNKNGAVNLINWYDIILIIAFYHDCPIEDVINDCIKSNFDTIT